MDQIRIQINGTDVNPNDQDMVRVAHMSMHGFNETDNNGNGSPKLLSNLGELPHGSLKRFSHFDFTIIGLSRRALAQITRHKVGIEFISSSLHYQFINDVNRKNIRDVMVCPYPWFLGTDAEREVYLDTLYANAVMYASTTHWGADASGYMLPLATRGNLRVTCNAEALGRLINQRLCKRSTHEMRYISLLILQTLDSYYGDSVTNLLKTAVPDCMLRGCREGSKSCGNNYCYANRKSLVEHEIDKYWMEAFGK